MHVHSYVPSMLNDIEHTENKSVDMENTMLKIRLITRMFQARITLCLIQTRLSQAQMRVYQTQNHTLQAGNKVPDYMNPTVSCIGKSVIRMSQAEMQMCQTQNEMLKQDQYYIMFDEAISYMTIVSGPLFGV